MRRVVWLPALCAGLWGQTQVDLRTQSKSVDFSSASFTKPMQAGTALPASCTVGQMFFLTTGAAGQNLYGCTAVNIWSLQAGGGGGGTVTVQSGGTTVGSRSTIDFAPGLGSLFAISDTGSAILIQPSADTAVMQTRAGEQSGGPLLCAPASGSASAYTCSLAPALTAYTAGMILHWKPDVTLAGGPATLNVDTLGAVALKLADGATDPGPQDGMAGRIYEVWFDGTAFRMVNPALPAGVLGEAQPACGASTRGRLWFVAGGTGAKDTLSVCAKDASNVFAWRTLF